MHRLDRKNENGRLSARCRNQCMAPWLLQTLIPIPRVRIRQGDPTVQTIGRLAVKSLQNPGGEAIRFSFAGIHASGVRDNSILDRLGAGLHGLLFLVVQTEALGFGLRRGRKASPEIVTVSL